MTQLALIPETTRCHWKGCDAPVVGSSTQSPGHVCRAHNEYEWGRALRSHWPSMSRALIASSGVTA